MIDRFFIDSFSSSSKLDSSSLRFSRLLQPFVFVVVFEDLFELLQSRSKTENRLVWIPNITYIQR